jgi:hypothetical protein
MKLNFMSTRFLRILVAAGYLLMCLLAGGIMYLWHYEWKEIEALETENQRINNFRQEIHHVYGEMTGLSFGRKCVGVGRRGFGALPYSAYGSGQYAMPFQNGLSSKTNRQCAPLVGKQGKVTSGHCGSIR